jgi:hypothetical protein
MLLLYFILQLAVWELDTCIALSASYWWRSNVRLGSFCSWQIAWKGPWLFIFQRFWLKLVLIFLKQTAGQPVGVFLSFRLRRVETTCPSKWFFRIVLLIIVIVNICIKRRVDFRLRLLKELDAVTMHVVAVFVYVF